MMQVETNDSFIELNSQEEQENTEPKKVTKFTDWAKEPTLAELKQDYIDAKSYHDAKRSQIDYWLDNLNIEGKAKIKKKPGRSNIVPKLIRKQAEWRYASLSEPFLSTPDVFNVDPITFEDKEGAIQNQLVLNNQFNTKLDKIRFIDEYVRTGVDEGTIICRTGWDFTEEEVEVEVEDFDYVGSTSPEYIQQLQVFMQQAQEDPDSFINDAPPEIQEAVRLSIEVGGPVEPIPVGSHIEIETKIVENHPTVEVCQYQHIMIDPSCRGVLDKAEFAIYSFSTNLSELEKTGKYQNLEFIDVEDSNIISEPDFYSNNQDSFNFNDKPRKKFVAYEYWGFWDIDDTGMVKPFVATWVGNTLIRMEENPFPDKKLPFVSIQYLPVRKSIYGEPDGALIEDNQRIIGAVTRGMIDIMGRSANGQQASRKDALDVTNKRKFDRGLDYEFNSQVDPKQAFHMHTFPEIPQSAGLMLQLQNNEAESLSGVKAFAQSGITGAALGDTATGVKSALDAVSKRELGILRRLAEGIKEIGLKFISMNSEFLSEEEVVRITNNEFEVIHRDKLAGQYDLALTISTAEADNDKASELAFMLQTMGNNMDPAMSQMILSDIARLRKMPALAKRIEEYQPQPDPMQEKIKELEVAKLEAEIEKLKSEAAENYAEAGLDQAKTAEASSNTDLKDLEYLEQESGVNQERDLEKAGAQAESQARLKAIDYAFKMKEDAANSQAVKV